MPRYSSRPASEEVINDPTVSKHYWRYRCVYVCVLCVCAVCVLCACVCVCVRSGL
jgi:hypothetical protein